MTSAQRTRSTWAAIVLALASCSKQASRASGEDAGPGAIRLHLHTVSSVVPLGTAVDVTIALRDFEGGRASAPHALEVELSVERGPRATVQFEPGDTELDVAVTPTRVGILEIRAAGRELVPGSCFVKVTRPQASFVLPSKTRAHPPGPARAKPPARRSDSRTAVPAPIVRPS